MCNTVMEKDKMVYTLLVALEIEDAAGHIGIGEREYLISPQFGALTMSAHNPNKPADRRVTEAKKPFDWMVDDQFHHLQLLAQNFDWFMEMFERLNDTNAINDRMSKDGREMAWRNLCEGDIGEAATLPDKMDEVLTPLQRLCIIRACRSDRIVQASSLFIQAVLGKRFVYDGTIDWQLLLNNTKNKTPIVLLYAQECEVVEKLFLSLANKRGINTKIVNITSPDMETELKPLIQKAITSGMWVLLQYGHNSPRLLASLETMLLDLEPMHPEFRCWVSAVSQPSAVPTRLLQISSRLQVDSPKAMKESLVRAFGMIDSEVLKCSGRAEWPAMLHNLCYIHSAIKLRARFHKAGLNAPNDLLQVGASQFLESLSLGVNEFKDGIFAIAADGKPSSKTPSWTGLRCMLAELVYGAYITDSYDQQAVSSIVDYWVSPLAIKKDFELARIKYKHPPAFFTPHPRLSILNQAMESLPNHFLDCPESCHLHPSLETMLGDDMYVFTRLNKVYDSMPATKSHSNKLFPRPPSPFDGPTMATTAPSMTPPHVLDLGVFATASYANLRMRKEPELAEIVFLTLQKLPKAYSKEYINDRIKKIGGLTPFNIWLTKELDVFFSLINVIKASLQAIKYAIDVNSLGDMLTPEQLSVADDLYYQKIPELWRRQSASTAPPPLQPLSTFINDIVARSTHFERILVLGREKNPAYWLGCFTNPAGLLALLKQEYIRSSISHDRSGNLENFVYQTEITNRDKDHVTYRVIPEGCTSSDLDELVIQGTLKDILRDPPADGMFIHGVYIWGASWEKTTGELIDAPPRHGCTALPVIHVTCWPTSEKPSSQDPVKSSETFQCPVFPSRVAARKPILDIDLRHEGIPASRWALRGLSATIRPF